MHEYTVSHRPRLRTNRSDDLIVDDHVIVHHEFSRDRWLASAIGSLACAVITVAALIPMLLKDHTPGGAWAIFFLIMVFLWMFNLAAWGEVWGDRKGYDRTPRDEDFRWSSPGVSEYDSGLLGTAFSQHFTMSDWEIINRVNLLLKSDETAGELLVTVMKAWEKNTEDVRHLSNEDMKQIISEAGKTYAELTCDDNLKYLREREDTAESFLKEIQDSEVTKRADKLRSDREMNHVSCGEGWND